MVSFGIINIVSAEKSSAGSEQTKEQQASRATVYTIQTGSFKDSQRAERQFKVIEKSLEVTPLQALRIEKIGRFYAVRVGRFASLAETKRFLKENAVSLEGAMVMKAYFIDERIILIHDGVKEDRPEGKAGIQRDRYLPDIPYAPNYLGLKLVGTALVDEPGNNIAIIENLDTGDQEIYKIGDTLNGVLIKRILSRGVIIDQGKGDEIIIMVGGKRTGPLQSESRREQRGKKVVDAKVPTYSAMMRGIGVRHYRQEGRPVGIAIYNIKSKSIFARAGLENCDVITAVNGKPVEVTQEPANFYKAFRQGGEITIDIKRDDINQKLSFEIK
jgi:type II secretory pathway component PulC